MIYVLLDLFNFILRVPFGNQTINGIRVSYRETIDWVLSRLEDLEEATLSQHIPVDFLVEDFHADLLINVGSAINLSKI
jgi:hypothetical protein